MMIKWKDLHCFFEVWPYKMQDEINLLNVDSQYQSSFFPCHSSKIPLSTLSHLLFHEDQSLQWSNAVLSIQVILHISM